MKVRELYEELKELIDAGMGDSDVYRLEYVDDSDFYYVAATHVMAGDT